MEQKRVLMLLTLLIGMLAANVEKAWSGVVTQTSTFTGFEGTTLESDVLTWTSSVVAFAAGDDAEDLGLHGVVFFNEENGFEPVTLTCTGQEFVSRVKVKVGAIDGGMDAAGAVAVRVKMGDQVFTCGGSTQALLEATDGEYPAEEFLFEAPYAVEQGNIEVELSAADESLVGMAVGVESITLVSNADYTWLWIGGVSMSSNSSVSADKFLTAKFDEHLHTWNSIESGDYYSNSQHQVRYTLDGSTPTLESELGWSKNGRPDISITNTCTMKYIVFEDGVPGMLKTLDFVFKTRTPQGSLYQGSTYQDVQELTLSYPVGSQSYCYTQTPYPIYYTLAVGEDPEDPTVETGTLYTEPIVLREYDTRVKAIGYCEGIPASVALLKYNILPAVRFYEGDRELTGSRLEVYNVPSSIRLASLTPDAEIYYNMTTDGTAPAAPTLENPGTRYTEPIAYTGEPFQLNAFAVKNGHAGQATGVRTAGSTLSPPAISFEGDYELRDGALVFHNPLTFTLSCETQGSDVRIYYTTNNTTPSAENGTLYTGPFTPEIFDDFYLRAIAYVDGQPSKPSSRWAGFEIDAQASVEEGEYSHELDVEFWSITEDVDIYWSTYTGNDYTSLEELQNRCTHYESPLHVGVSMYGSNYAFYFYHHPSGKILKKIYSYVVRLNCTASIVINGRATSAVTGNFSSPVTVSFTHTEATEDVQIVYFVHESYRNAHLSDAERMERLRTEGIVWDGQPFTVDHSCNIYFALTNGYIYNTGFFCFYDTYYVVGRYYANGTEIYNDDPNHQPHELELALKNYSGQYATESNFKIYYNITFDGTEPAVPTPTTGTCYQGERFDITQQYWVKAVAYKNDGTFHSCVLDQKVVLSSYAPYVSQTNPYSMWSPTFTNYNQVTASLACQTAGARIYYTLDGSEPTEETGTLYDAQSRVVIDTTCVIKMRAYAEGFAPSSVSSSQFVTRINQPKPYVSEGLKDDAVKIFFYPGNNTLGNTYKIFFTIDGTDPLTSESRIECVKSSSDPNVYMLDESATVRYVQVDGRSHSEIGEVVYTLKDKAPLSFEEESLTVAINDDFVSPQISNALGVDLTWTSDNAYVASVDANGVVTLNGFGTATITASFAGNSDYRKSSASYQITVEPRSPELGSQVNTNPRNLLEPISGITRINITSTDFTSDEEGTEIPAMTISNGHLYVSAFYDQENGSWSSEYWDYDEGGMIFKSNPRELTPNWGAALFDADGQRNDVEMLPGRNCGGLMSFLLPAGKGTIMLDAHTNSEDAVMGLRVAGCEELTFSGWPEDVITYSYDISEPTYAYVYGISLARTNGNGFGYVKSITVVPEGEELYQVKVGGTVLSEDNADVLQDGGSVRFYWGYPPEDVSEGGDVDTDGGDKDVDRSVATIVLSNATIATDGEPAIEVNGLDMVIVLLEGVNTVSTTNANATISIGTLNGNDWASTQLTFAPRTEGVKGKLIVPRAEEDGTEFGIYSYDGAISQYDVNLDVAGVDFGLFFRMTSQQAGYGGELNAPQVKPQNDESLPTAQAEEAEAGKKPAKMPSWVTPGSMEVMNGSLSLRGTEAAMWGVTRFNISGIDLVESDLTNPEFYAWGEFETGRGGCYGEWSDGNMTWATYLNFGSDPNRVRILGNSVTEDNDDVLQDGGSVKFSWGAPEGYLSDNDEGLTTATITLTNANLEGDGVPAIEANDIDLLFVMLNGENSLASNAGAVVSIGTSNGIDKTSATGTLLVVMPEDPSTVPSLQIAGNGKGTSGLYLFNGSAEMDNVDIGIEASLYGILARMSSGGNGDVLNAPQVNKLPRADRHGGRASRMAKMPGYMKACAVKVYGGTLELRGTEAAMWGLQSFYTSGITLVESDLENPEFIEWMSDSNEGGTFYVWNEENDCPVFAQYLRFGMDSSAFTEKVAGINVIFRIIDEVGNLVQTGPSQGGNDCSTAVNRATDVEVVIPATVDHEGQTYTVTTLGPSTFDGCSSIPSVKVYADVSSLGQYVFYDCSSLRSIYFYNTPTPPTSDELTNVDFSNVFYSVRNCVLYVPAGSKQAYEEDEKWGAVFGENNEYGNSIVEIGDQPQQQGDVNGDGTVTVQDIDDLVGIVLGKSTKYDANIADVNGDGQVTIADVTKLVNMILGKESQTSTE